MIRNERNLICKCLCFVTELITIQYIYLGVEYATLTQLIQLRDTSLIANKDLAIYFSTIPLQW